MITLNRREIAVLYTHRTMREIMMALMMVQMMTLSTIMMLKMMVMLVLGFTSFWTASSSRFSGTA